MVPVVTTLPVDPATENGTLEPTPRLPVRAKEVPISMVPVPVSGEGVTRMFELPAVMFSGTVPPPAFEASAAMSGAPISAVMNAMRAIL